MSKWIELYRPAPMRGHKVFINQRNGRVAIADWSGTYPDQTDDGTLYVDDAKAATVVMRDNGQIDFIFNVLSPDGESSLVMTSAPTMQALMRHCPGLLLRYDSNGPIAALQHVLAQAKAIP